MDICKLKYIFERLFDINWLLVIVKCLIGLIFWSWSKVDYKLVVFFLFSNGFLGSIFNLLKWKYWKNIGYCLINKII